MKIFSAITFFLAVIIAVTVSSLFLTYPRSASSYSLAHAEKSPSNIKNIDLTPSEKAWLENHKTIRVGMSPVFPPLKFVENGIIKGVEPDMLDLLSEISGVRFEYVVSDFSKLETKAKTGEVDMFLSFNIPERLSYMSFTTPFMEFRNVFVTRNDTPFISNISALNGKKIAVVKGVKLFEKFLAPYPQIEMVRFDNMEQMFNAVAESRADALISKTLFAGYIIQNFPNLKISGIADLPTEPYLYAVRKDYPELVSILNKAIASIPNEKKDAMIQKWFNVRIEYHPHWHEIMKWVLLSVGVFGVMLVMSLLWNMRLKREVKRRTQAEAQMNDMQQQLSHQEKMAAIGQLAAGVAHEINNPIGYISSNMMTLEKYVDKLCRYLKITEQELSESNSGKLTPAAIEARNNLKLEYVIRDLDSLISENKDGLERVGNIVKDLQTFSTTGNVMLSAVDLNRCMDDVINIISSQISQVATLDLQYSELPPVECNAQQICQVFMHLLVNAIHAIKSKGEGTGRIIVRTSSDSKYVYLAVSDNGCGIEGEKISRIFDVFYSTKDVGSGTGLGLAISRQIMHRHGGDISVESKPFAGATFTVKLPVIRRSN